MQNLTGVPSVWGDLNLAGQTMQQLSEQEAQRKKKIMAGGQSSDFQNATQFLFGQRLNPAGNPMA